ncbi:MAG TPA: hypothetical protein VE954_31845 [Oligoflexus sp.]|uniref:hypothetical protein n=1 Tax=Oligoflexus sp. TaxID=1971216 RepID=UPI002D3D67F1|nr:hypothetical protein [Oligoflexus sp.]HYX37718.1 hypothetical protein [Oligoflexus sp.]
MTGLRPEDAVKHYLQRWLNIPGNNLRILEEISQIPYNTLHRLSQGANAPSANVLSAIGEVICSRSEIIEVMDLVGPSIANLMRIWSSLDNPGEKHGKRNYVCNDKYLFSVYALCSRVYGASHGEIKECYGKQGLEYLQILVTEETVQVMDGRIYVTDRGIVFNERFNHKAISYLNEMCPEACSENPYSTRLWVIENLNENTIRELARKVRELESNVRKIVCDPNNYGDGTWIFTMVSEGKNIENSDMIAEGE